MKIEIVSLEPLMVKQSYPDGDTYTIVLHPFFDKELMEYIKNKELKVGDIIK